MAASTPASAQLERSVLALPPVVVEMRAAALLMSGQEGGDLDLVAKSFIGPQVVSGQLADDGLRVVLVVVEVDGLGVLEGAAAMNNSATGGSALEVLIYAVGSSLDVRDAVTGRLDGPEAYEAQLLDAGVRILAPLRLDSGPQELRVLARVGDRFGLRRLEIGVPLPDSPDSDSPDSDSPDSGDGSPEPLTLDASGRWLVAWSQQRPADDPALGLTFDPVASQPMALNLLAEVQDGTEGSAESGRRAEPWPSAMRRAGGDVFTGVRADAEGGSGAGLPRLPEELARHLDALLDGYYDAVALRAEGERMGAARLLAGLEAEALERLGDGGLEMLAGREVRGYERLRRRLSSVRPLIGLIRLHLDTAEEHRRAGRYRLSTLAVASAIRMSEGYADEAEDAKDDALPREAASILASLAAAVQVRGSLTEAVALYRQALDHVPDDPVALFGLATLLSKVGEAKAAAEIYGQLVAVAPEHHEARLRWAVMLQREGGFEALTQAGEQFRRLAAGDAEDVVPTWIASLSCQQLVRLALDGERIDEAAKWLGFGLERWPDHIPLRVAQLRLAELQGDPDAVGELLSRLDPQSGTPALSPGGRTRFHDASHPEMQRLHQYLTQLEADRRQELANAVAALRERSRGGRRGGAP